MPRVTLTDEGREKLAGEMESIATGAAKLYERMTKLESDYPYLRTFQSFTSITDQLSEIGETLREWEEYVHVATDEPWREPTPPSMRATNPKDGKVPL